MQPPLKIKALLLLSIIAKASSRPQGEDGERTMGGEDGGGASNGQSLNQPASTRDPLRWIWIDETSLGLTWSSKFSLSLNDAVRGYGLSLTHPQHSKPFISNTIYNSRNLQHQFEGLKSNVTYGGKLEALVGQHHWPYNLLNFTFSSANLLSGVGLGQRSAVDRPISTTADLGGVTVGVTLRWSHSPFTTGALTASEWDAIGGRPEGLKPDGYLLQIWDHKRLILKLTTSVTGKHDGCMASISGLSLDTVYKATLEGLHLDGRVGSTLSFSLDAGGFHVAGGALTTDGVSECYSGLQVRCPGSERCVSPYWICDGAPDCPDGVDEIGCDKSPCDGFRCWDNICIPGAWRCDGHRDCKDGDDEYACAGCSEGETACPTVGFCFFPNATCNGIPDCPDGWDESLAVCGGKECSPGELPCWDNDHCVEHYRLCDGIPDCPTAEDEDRSFCITIKSMQETTTLAVDLQASLCDHNYNHFKKTNCSLDEFLCESGECIPRMYICNGHIDCQTEDDEDALVCPLDNDIISAKDEIPKNKIDSEEVSINSCGENMVKCPSGKCILKTEKCKTNAQCDDNHLDEASCKNYSDANLNNDIGSNHISGDLNLHSNTNISDNFILDTLPTLSSAALEGENRRDLLNDTENTIPTQLHTSESADYVIGIVNMSSNLTLPPVLQDIDLESLEDSEEGTFVQEDITTGGIDVSVEVIVEDTADSAEGKLESATIGGFDVTDNLIPDSEIYNDKEMFIPFGNVSITTNGSISASINSSDEFGDNESEDTTISEYETSIFENFNISSSEENEFKSMINSTRILNLDSDEEIDVERLLSTSDKTSSDETDTSNVTITSNLNTPDTAKQNITDSDEINIESHQTESVNMMTETSIYNITLFEDPISVEENMNVTTEAEGDSFSYPNTTEGSPTTIIASDNKDVASQNFTTKELDVVETGSSPMPNITDMLSVGDGTTLEPAIDTKWLPQLNNSEETVHSDFSEHSTPKDEVVGQHEITTELPLSEHDDSLTTFTTEPDNWKDMQMGQKNLTILIAVHSLGNESKIPQYIIHGMDGSTYEYEVVSINNEEGVKDKTELQDEDNHIQMMNHDLNGGIHELSYLQDSVSSGMRSSSLCIMLIMSSVISIFLTVFGK